MKANEGEREAKQGQETDVAQAYRVPAEYLQREEYREALEEVERFLSFVFFRLDELNADLAVEGAHKKWADAQGPVLFLDELDYGKSDDPVLRDLAALHVRLKGVLDRLSIGPRGEQEPPPAGPRRDAGLSRGLAKE
ncbi:MAG TPA: hypothetical protein VGK67_13325 [Myxococcales bacterium]|jgi:hypothetical protein